MVASRIIHSKPALLVQGQKRHLVIADLHIGFESKMASNNVFIGKNSTIGETISDVADLIRSQNPDSLILLGDVKSSIRSITKSEWHDVPLFFEEMEKITDIVLVPGNHDANIDKLVPSGTTMTGPTGLVLDNTLFTHGHAMPSANFAHVDKIVMGHIHPVFFDPDSVLNGQRVWVSLNAQKQDIFSSERGTIEMLLVPSFNRYFYASHKQYKKSISPLIQRLKKIESAKIITLDGSIIGDESMLSHVI